MRKLFCELPCLFTCGILLILALSDTSFVSETVAAPQSIQGDEGYIQFCESIPSKRPEYLKYASSRDERLLIVLVGFPDTDTNVFTKTSYDDWNSVFFGNRPSVRDYFSTLSFGDFSLHPAVERNQRKDDGVVGWNVLTHPLAWYKATYPSNFDYARVIANEALISANGAVDFENYDENDDDFISSHELHIFIVLAAYEATWCAIGTSEPEINRVHVRGGLTAGSGIVELDGKVIGDPEHGGVSLAGEILNGTLLCLPAPIFDQQNKVGLLAHEIGHSLGLPDHYHRPDSAGIWCLMASGDIDVEEPSFPNHLCAPHKEQLGWIRADVIRHDATRIISEIAGGGASLKLWENGNPTTEYFIAENRNRQTGDSYDQFLPSSGLLIWHVDSTEIRDITQKGQGVELEQADGEGPDGAGNAGDPFSEETQPNFLEAATFPNSRSHSGDITGVVVANVSVPGANIVAEIAVSHLVTGIAIDVASNSLPADGVSTILVSAMLIDAWQDTVESADDLVIFTITSGAASAQLNGPNPATPVNGVAQITLQSTTTPGIVTVEASSPGLTSGSTSVVVFEHGGETEVHGQITTNTTWTFANSPYVVVGDITIKKGIKLTIEPGVTVRLNPDMDMFVNGGLVADGLPNAKIIFTANTDSPAPGFWGGIQFNADAIDSFCILDHVVINYGGDIGLGIDHPVVIDARVNPTIRNTVIENNRTNGLALIPGRYRSDVTLDIDTLPYALFRDFTIDPGAVLHIEPGVTLKMAAETDIFIKGGLSANGASSRRILFTSLTDDSHGGDTNGDGLSQAAKGDWGGIEIQGTVDDGQTRLHNCDILFAGHQGLAIDYPIFLDPNANPAITNTTITKCRINGVAVKRGHYTSDILLDIIGLPYVLQEITMREGATLTIAPGALLKMPLKTDIFVRGGLIANGTAERRITFTSLRDDSRGGDTDGEGATSGSAQDWGGILFESTVDDAKAILNYCDLYFGGATGLAVDHPIVLDARVNPRITNVILQDNRTNGINLRADRYRANVRLDHTELPYSLYGDLTISDNFTLSIQPGVLLKCAKGVDLFIDATLQAIGTAEQPIIFTSIRDDSRGGDTNGDGSSSAAAGDWRGLLFRDLSSDEHSLMDNVQILYAGERGRSLGFDNASPRIQNVTISQSKRNGVATWDSASPDLGGGARGSIGGNRFLGFLDNADQYAVRVWGPTEVFAQNNSWETDDYSVIDLLIYDRRDDPRRGLVIYDPISDVQVAETDAQIPETFLLFQNYPNPFNPETTIRYQLPRPEHVSLAIFNLRGQRVRNLVDAEVKRGVHEIIWAGVDELGNQSASGVYLVRMVARDYAVTRKLLLVR